MLSTEKNDAPERNGQGEHAGEDSIFAHTPLIFSYFAIPEKMDNTSSTAAEPALSRVRP